MLESLKQKIERDLDRRCDKLVRWQEGNFACRYAAAEKPDVLRRW